MDRGGNPCADGIGQESAAQGVGQAEYAAFVDAEQLRETPERDRISGLGDPFRNAQTSIKTLDGVSRGLFSLSGQPILQVFSSLTSAMAD